jgi:hypothetical protein
MEYELKLSGTPFDDGAIDLDKLPSEDAFFSRNVVRETVAQQLERQISARKTVGNRLAEYIGFLADAEGSYENDLKMLRE